MNSEDLLFTNKFVNLANPRLSTKNTQNSNFRTHYESIYKRKEGLSVDRGDSDNHGIPDISSITNKIETKTIVTIDSKDRDKVKYPFQSNFSIFLGRSFNNVKSIGLVSTEVPNTDTVIKEIPAALKNNRITWINEEDIDLGIFKDAIINTSTEDYIDILLQDHPFEIGEKINVEFFNSKPDASATVTNYLDGLREITVISEDTVRIRYTGGNILQGLVDIDIGHPVYYIDIKPGNYTASTLAEEIEGTLNNVKRRNGTGQYHYFEVTVNLDTDVMAFDSVITTQLANNPLSTTASSSIITVRAPSHSLKTGDRVKMIGVKNTAGISGTILKGDFIVTVLDFNTFTYEINERAVDTVDGGGNVVKIGKDAPFRLLFNSGDTLIQFNTGFPDEDSSLALTENSNITTKAPRIVGISSIYSNEFLKITTATDHSLIPCNKGTISSIIQSGEEIIITTAAPHQIDIPKVVFIRNSNCIPSIDGYSTAIPAGDNTFVIDTREINVSGTSGEFLFDGDTIKINGIKTAPPIDHTHFFFVEETPVGNEIIVKFKAFQIIDFSSATVGTEHVSVKHPNHSFNSLINISNYTPDLTNCVSLLEHSFIGSITDNTQVVEGPVDTNTIDILLELHGLFTSDFVKIENSTCDPSIDGSYIIQVVDQNTFRINFVYGSLVPGTCTVITGDTVFLNETNSVPKVNGLFNIANKLVINSISTGAIVSTINTDGALGWVVGDLVEVSNSNSSPTINGPHYIQSVLSPTSFTINLEIDIDTPGTTGIVVNKSRFLAKTGKDVITTGTSGIINRDQVISLFRVKPEEDSSESIGGISINSINQKNRKILKIIDKDNYIVRYKGSYSTKSISAGGDEITISSLSHGYRSIQANTVTGLTTGELYRSISLQGEDYIFLRSTGLDTIVNSSGLSNIFAKILLNDAPGNMVFNSFISAPKVFDPPVPKIDVLTFEMVTSKGYHFNFNDIDWSFSLEVIEVLDSLSFNNSASNSVFFGGNTRNDAESMERSSKKVTRNKNNKLDTANTSQGVIRARGGRSSGAIIQIT